MVTGYGDSPTLRILQARDWTSPSRALYEFPEYQRSPVAFIGGPGPAPAKNPGQPRAVPAQAPAPAPAPRGPGWHYVRDAPAYDDLVVIPFGIGRGGGGAVPLGGGGMAAGAREFAGGPGLSPPAPPSPLPVPPTGAPVPDPGFLPGSVGNAGGLLQPGPAAAAGTQAPPAARIPSAGTQAPPAVRAPAGPPKPADEFLTTVRTGLDYFNSLALREERPGISGNVYRGYDISGNDGKVYHNNVLEEDVAEHVRLANAIADKYKKLEALTQGPRATIDSEAQHEWLNEVYNSLLEYYNSPVLNKNNLNAKLYVYSSDGALGKGNSDRASQAQYALHIRNHVEGLLQDMERKFPGMIDNPLFYGSAPADSPTAALLGNG